MTRQQEAETERRQNRGQLAERLVRDWSAEQRARNRLLAAELGMDGLVALIDAEDQGKEDRPA